MTANIYHINGYSIFSNLAGLLCLISYANRLDVPNKDCKIYIQNRSIKDTLARRGSVLKNRVENLNDEVSVARNFDYEHKWGKIRF